MVSDDTSALAERQKVPINNSTLPFFQQKDIESQFSILEQPNKCAMASFSDNDDSFVKRVSDYLRFAAPAPTPPQENKQVVEQCQSASEQDTSNTQIMDHYPREDTIEAPPAPITKYNIQAIAEERHPEEDTSDDASFDIPDMASTFTVDNFLSMDTTSIDGETIGGARYETHLIGDRRPVPNKSSSPDYPNLTMAPSAKTMKAGNTASQGQGFSNGMEPKLPRQVTISECNVQLQSAPQHTIMFGGDAVVGQTSRGDEFIDHPDIEADNRNIETPSPKQRRDHAAAPNSPSAFEERGEMEKKKEFEMQQSFRDEHLSWFSLGPIKTLLPIILAMTAFWLSVSVKNSTRFVDLEIPIEFGGNYESVSSMGLFYVEVCRADEIVSVDYTTHLVTISKLTFADNSSIDEEPVAIEITRMSTLDYTPQTATTLSEEYVPNDDEKVCAKIRLTAETIGDGLWNCTRIFVGFTEWLGGLMAFTLIFACFWKTMNLVPIATGLLVTYICQAFSFFFLDTELCKTQGCSQSSGGAMAIAAVMCWFLAWVGVLNMIMYAGHEKRKMNILEKKQDIAAAIYASKRTSRIRSYMQNQLSFLRLFSNSSNVRDENLSDTSGSSSESDEEHVRDRVEI